MWLLLPKKKKKNILSSIHSQGGFQPQGPNFGKDQLFNHQFFSLLCLFYEDVHENDVFSPEMLQSSLLEVVG